MDLSVLALRPFLYIGIFGAAAVSFLWLRDARIYYRTGSQGYRKAAYQGILYAALAWFGCSLCGFTDQTFYFLGIGCVLLALYLQSRIKKENVWTGNEKAWTRFIGSAPYHPNHPKNPNNKNPEVKYP